VLRHGDREPVLLRQVDVNRRAPILRCYLQRAPGARAHIPVDYRAPVEAFPGTGGISRPDDRRIRVFLPYQRRHVRPIMSVTPEETADWYADAFRDTVSDDDRVHW
jgi:hypothetical protein